MPIDTDTPDAKPRQESPVKQTNDEYELIPMVVQLPSFIRRELEYLVQLHRVYGAPNPMESIEDLAGYLLVAIADGSRRPGAWERTCLEMMGLVADSELHQEYRSDYGPTPANTEMLAHQHLQQAVGMMKDHRKQGATTVVVRQNPEDLS